MSHKLGTPMVLLAMGGGIPKGWKTPIIAQTGDPSNPFGYGGGTSKGWKTSIVLQMVGDPNCSLGYGVILTYRVQDVPRAVL